MPPKNTSSWFFDEDPNPAGICQCGCGQPTAVSTFNNGQTGYRKGFHKVFIQGHAQGTGLASKACEACDGVFWDKPSKMITRHYCSTSCAAIASRGEIGLTPSNIERFWTHVDRSGGPNACWEWTGPRSRLGYGRFSICQVRHIASRVAAEIAYGPCPEDRRTCHACDNPPCCNLAHLYYGTAKDNTQDAIRRGRFRGYDLSLLYGEVHPKARLTEAQVIDIRRRWGVAHFNVAAEARKLGVRTPSVWAIINQTHWRHLPSVEELKDAA